MKKLIFIAVLIFGLSTAANAQDVGQFWAGGGIGFTSSKLKGADNSTTSFKIMPEFGYVLSENLGVGINVGYGQTKYGDYKTNNFVVSPFVRYSFLKGDIGGLFVDGGVGYTHQKADDVKTNIFEVGFRPGVAVNVSNRIALTGKFGFLGYKHEKAGDAKTNSYGFDLDLSQVLLGVSIVF